MLTATSMLTKEQAHDIFERAKKFSTADDIEILIAGGRSALTRFANNTIHQNVAEENYIISVRSVMGQRTARATTNKFDDASLKRVVAAAESVTRVQHPDSDLLPMATPAEVGDGAHAPNRFFEETAAIEPEDRAEGVREIVAVAKKHKLITAG